MGPADKAASIDELLDRAVDAINSGDRAGAQALASQVLSLDDSNAEAEDLLAVSDAAAEIRRLTTMFVDMVDSTALSARVEPETYRSVVGRFRTTVRAIVERFEGHIASTKGDGLLAVFGYPIAHENDVGRAVLAGLEITREVTKLSELAQRRFGFGVAARVGIHRGLVYLDTAEDDVYGLGANLAARVSALAPPGSVVVSDIVGQMVGSEFELCGRPPVPVKGVDDPIVHYEVKGERPVESTEPPRCPMVGRDIEQQVLQEHWSRAQYPTSGTRGIVVRGEAGIGKTRLVLSAAELAQRSGAVVLQMYGSPLHTGTGLFPVRTLLERRCAIGRLTSPRERLGLLEAEVTRVGLDASELVPLLAPVLGLGPEDGYEPVHAEGRKLYELISDGVRSYLLACFGDQPGLLVAEDAHWFDATSLELLGALLRAAADRLLVVVTGRPGEWLPADWPVDVLDLKPLTDDQSDTLILTLDPTVSADDRAHVRNRCDGVPFYIEQVMNALAAARAGGGNAKQVPEALYEPLFARLRTCANAIPVVEAAGIIGRHVDRGLLAAVCTLRDTEIDEVSRELQRAGVFEPWSGDGWRFRHELLREVAAELAPASVRRKLHGRVADALVAAGGDPDWPLVATHYQNAERFGDAANARQQASAAARRRGALAEARSHLTLALENLDRSPPGPDRDRREVVVRLERGLLAAAAELYTSEAVASDFEKCLELGGADLADDELVATLLSLVSYYATRVDLRRMAEVLHVLRSRLGGRREWFRPAIDASVGVLEWLRGEFSAANLHFEQATEPHVSDAHPIEAVWYLPNEPIASAHLHLALTRLIRGDLADAMAQLEASRRRAAELGFPQGPFMSGYARFIESWIHLEVGRFHRAAALATELDEHAERHGFDQWRLVAATVQAAARAGTVLNTTHPDSAAVTDCLEQMTAVLGLWRAVGLDIYLTFFDAVVARLLIAADQLDRARTYLDDALQATAEMKMCFYAAELLRLRARTHRDIDNRRADLRAAFDTASAQGAVLFQLRAALDDLVLHGDADRAAVVDVMSHIPADSGLPELALGRLLAHGR